MIRKLDASPGEGPDTTLNLLKPMWTSRMSQNDQGLVDLLEIFHARQIRDQIIEQLRRLRIHDPMNPFHDEGRRVRARGQYESMLLAVAELLGDLGDELPLG
jgi:hypothetical protein